MAYFSGQGILKLATRSGSPPAPGTFRDVGNVPEFRVNLEVTKIEHKESRTGQRISDARLITEKKVSVTMVLEDLTKENLELALYGNVDQLPAADTVHMFTEGETEWWVKFEGVNTVNNKNVTVELFRVVFDPLQEFSGISDEFGKFTLEGTALYDKENDIEGATLGGFGRVSIEA